jgi:YD repeat-containing protein
MLARAFKLAWLLPMAGLASWTPALAQEGAYQQLRGWSLYRNQTNCSAYMLFENGEAVGFTYDAPGRSTRITFSDANANRLEDGDSPSLDILLRHPDGTVDHTYEATVFMVSVDEDGRRTLTSRWLGPPALQSFSDASVVGFYEGERQIGVFNLTGTAAALQEVERCSTQLGGNDG